MCIRDRYLTVDTASTEPVVKEEAGDPEADKNAEPVEGDVDSAYTVDDHPVISVDKEVTVVGKDCLLYTSTARLFLYIPTDPYGPQ